MISRSSNNYFAGLKEPHRSCLLLLREEMLGFSKEITEAWKFNTPFYYYKKKWLGFISFNPKNGEIYISFANGCRIKHPKLLSEGRKQHRIFRVEAEADIDVAGLREILRRLLASA